MAVTYARLVVEEPQTPRPLHEKGTRVTAATFQTRVSRVSANWLVARHSAIRRAPAGGAPHCAYFAVRGQLKLLSLVAFRAPRLTV